MHLLFWSKRAVIGCLALWGVLVTIYLVLGAVRHEALPPPYNLLIMLLLSTATAGSGAAWFTGRLEAQSDRILATQETRDGRLYFEMARMRGEVAQLRDLIEKTADLTRPLALAGADYDNGFADGLARSPMKEAKILPMAPREGGGS